MDISIVLRIVYVIMAISLGIRDLLELDSFKKSSDTFKLKFQFLRFIVVASGFYLVYTYLADNTVLLTSFKLIVSLLIFNSAITLNLRFGGGNEVTKMWKYCLDIANYFAFSVFAVLTFIF